jgi:hypothetical protein
MIPVRRVCSGEGERDRKKDAGSTGGWPEPPTASQWPGKAEYTILLRELEVAAADELEGGADMKGELKDTAGKELLAGAMLDDGEENANGEEENRLAALAEAAEEA